MAIDGPSAGLRPVAADGTSSRREELVSRRPCKGKQSGSLPTAAESPKVTSGLVESPALSGFNDKATHPLGRYSPANPPNLPKGSKMASVWAP